MVLEVNKIVWKLHFHTEDVQITDPEHPPLWNRLVRVNVHSGPCIDSVSTPTHCVNGAMGIAKCSRKDQFVRAKGNRLALTKAIKHLPEQTRKAIWAAYWLKARRPKETTLHFQARIAATAPQPAQVELGDHPCL